MIGIINDRKLYLIVAILSIILCGGVLLNIFLSTDNRGGINGQIVDSHDNLPISHANIYTDPPTSAVITNNRGNYTIADIPPNTYNIIVSKVGYTTSQVKIAVTADKITTADIVLATKNIEAVLTKSPQITQTLTYNLRETMLLPISGQVLALGNMDGDKALDIAISNPDTRTITILEQTETGIVSQFTIVEPDKLRGPMVADVDRDGLLEILSGNFSGQVQIWEASGDNEYGLAHTEFIGNFIEGSVVGDSDGDGFKEFLIAQEAFPSKIFILEAMDGIYQNVGSLTGDGGNCGIIGTLDLDGDGMPETVFHDDNYRPDKRKTLYIYEDNMLIFKDDQQSAGILGDTDGNGLGEIIGIENSTGNLRILESSGTNNNFVEVFNAPADGYANRIVDVQHDGYMAFWRVTDGGSGYLNVLWFASRTGKTITPIYNSDLLFQNFPGNIKQVLAVGDTNYNDIPELAVVQGRQIHILEKE